MKPTDFAYHLTNYLSRYLPGQLGVSANTIKSYRDTFMILIRYCKDQKGIPSERLLLKDLTRDVVEDFLMWLETERNCSISTRNQRLSAIHAFFKYLQYECPESIELFQRIISIPTKRKPKKAFDYLTLEGVQAILSQPNQSTRGGFRDLVLLTLMYDSGARVQEIADLTISDLRLDEPATVRLTGKGSKTRIVPLMSRTAELLLKYSEHFRASNYLDSAPLFYNKKCEKLTRSGISFVLDKYTEMARRANPKVVPLKVTPHTLRHSKAMHLLQSGVNIVYIRDVLGHSEIKTTEVYARADTHMKRKALVNANQPEIQSEVPVWQKNNDLLCWLKNLG
ncbi:MAG: site-specific integrase [Oscillospiraceae bacterium]|nr:site-specific integrase [Oscillospiraceae bacterium]